MITISKAQAVVTLINPHICKPGKQDALARLVIDATQSIYRHEKGFVSASIHRSSDGLRVTNYAQYGSRDDVETAWKNPAIPGYAEQVAALADSFDAHLYEVASVIKAGGATEEGDTITIETGQPSLTLIEVFTCEDANQKRLVDLLAETVRAIYQASPGFLSASVHKSLDGVRVANYEQWRSREDLNSAEANPALVAYQQKIKGLITAFDGTHPYEVSAAMQA